MPFAESMTCALVPWKAKALIPAAASDSPILGQCCLGKLMGGCVFARFSSAFATNGFTCIVMMGDFVKGSTSISSLKHRRPHRSCLGLYFQGNDFSH